MGRTNRFLQEKQMGFQQNKWKIRKFVIMFVYASMSWSFHLFQAIKLPPEKGFMVGLLQVSLLGVKDSSKRIYVNSYFSEVSAFSQISKVWRRLFFLHLLNLKCLRLKIIFIPTPGSKRSLTVSKRSRQKQQYSFPVNVTRHATSFLSHSVSGIESQGLPRIPGAVVHGEALFGDQYCPP